MVFGKDYLIEKDLTSSGNGLYKMEDVVETGETLGIDDDGYDLSTNELMQGYIYRGEAVNNFVKIDDVNYLAGYTGKEDHLILPHDVNGEKYTISGYAFYMNDFIKSIEISDLVTKIGEKAFYNCSNLREVIITENSLLEEIEYYAFYNCLKLRSFVFPKNLNILNDPFYNCINVRVVYNLSRYSETVVKGMFRYAEVIVNTIRNDDFIKNHFYCFIMPSDRHLYV